MSHKIAISCLFAILATSRTTLAGPIIINKLLNHANVVSPITMKSTSTNAGKEIDFIVTAVERADDTQSDQTVFSQILMMDLCSTGYGDFKSIIRPELIKPISIILNPDNGYFTLIGYEPSTIFKLKDHDLRKMQKLNIIAQQAAPRNH